MKLFLKLVELGTVPLQLVLQNLWTEFGNLSRDLLLHEVVNLVLHPSFDYVKYGEFTFRSALYGTYSECAGAL